MTSLMEPVKRRIIGWRVRYYLRCQTCSHTYGTTDKTKPCPRCQGQGVIYGFREIARYSPD